VSENVPDSLLSLLGTSIKSKDLRVAMKSFAMSAPKYQIDSEGNRYD
jgi:hypothetical protein